LELKCGFTSMLSPLTDGVGHLALRERDVEIWIFVGV
jgi:hypothetical protein